MDLFTISVAPHYDSIDWMFEAMAGTVKSVGGLGGLFYLLLLFLQD